VQPGLDARDARTVQGEPVGGGQQQFEEDEQVEKIAGQEGAVEAHQQKLEQRVEMRAGAVPAGEREHQGGGGQDARQKQHERRQAVHDEHDGEWHRPGAEPVHAGAGG
jgi:hypothetical protein